MVGIYGEIVRRLCGEVDVHLLLPLAQKRAEHLKVD